LGCDKFHAKNYASSIVFDDLSKKEIAAWAAILVFAVGLTIFGSVYLAGAFMTADVSSALPRPAKPAITESP
jgi:ABC-type uncharacterized transport system permease subunit